MKIKTNPPGFTLIEIMAVVLIIATLSGVAIPTYLRRIAVAKQKKTAVRIEKIALALTFYFLDNDSYPTTEQGLEALLKKPQCPPYPRKWRSNGYLHDANEILDAWSNDILYTSNTNNQFELVSLGADGKIGGERSDADIRKSN